MSNILSDHFDIFSSPQPLDIFEKSFKNQKVDVSKIKDLYTTEPEFKRSDGDIAMEIDDLKIFESILSKQFPSERYNGMVNLLYVLTNPKATSEEIQSALVRQTKVQNTFDKIHDFFILQIWF